MSAASHPAPKAPGRVTKKTRQPKEKDNDETPQRARKRALDREAQRTFREKTKNYIAHLVETVEACKAENESQLVKQLLDQNASLYRTIEHLRKILTDIYTATEPEILRGNMTNQAPPASCNPPQDQRPRSPPAENATAQSVVSPSAGNNGLSAPSFAPNEAIAEPTQSRGLLETSLDNHIVDIEPSSSNDYFDSSTQVIDQHVSEPIPDTLFEHLSRANTWEEAQFGPQSHLDGHTSMTGIELSTPRWMPVEFHLPMQVAFNPDMELYQNLWGVTNSVYNKIFDISPSQASAARNSDIGVIFKAIKNGWDTLSDRDQSNPVVQILGAYDALISGHLDQVNRVAIAFKNFHLIKYFLNPDVNDLERMPAWQRPRASQRRQKHPILIDFFAWPGLRERLIRGDTRIPMESKKFSESYLKHFQFMWPFCFEDTFQHCPTTDSYSASPLFERYHRDLRCWSMQKKFFWEYPELMEDITSPESSADDPTEVVSQPQSDYYLLDILSNMPSSS